MINKPKLAVKAVINFGMDIKHMCVDMQSGLINKVAVAPANVTDAKGLKHVLPKKGQFMLIRAIVPSRKDQR